MRATVLVSEYLVYVPAVIVAVRWLSKLEHVNFLESAIALAAILLQPATLLIDHGHFQYNTVMLGFAMASISSLFASRIRWACVHFVLALGFKQMALFYAPAIFAYLLGSCISPRIDAVRLITIALTTAAAFALLFAPLLLGAIQDTRSNTFVQSNQQPPLFQALGLELDSSSILRAPLIVLTQCIHRIFPFARGLFEDKVANLWCAVHTFHKLNRYSSQFVQRAALLATLAAITPPCLIVFLRPRKNLIPLAFAATAWGFFLCSYQVHEKNVLLPLLPTTLILASQGGLNSEVRSWIGFANILGSWTLFPLLRRDGLQIPYYVLTLLWAYLLGLPPTSLSVYTSIPSDEGASRLSALIQLPFYAAMVGWHVLDATVAPSSDKPDLWVVANVLIGAAGFSLCYLWSLVILLQKSGLLQSSATPQKKVQ